MIRVKDFNLLHTTESGQPLTFYGNYSNENGKEKLSYVTQDGIIYLTIWNSKVSYSFKGEYNEESAKKEIYGSGGRTGFSRDMK